MRKARAVAHEFQGSLEQMVRDAELDEVRQKVEKASSFNVKDEIARHIDPQGEIHGGLSDQVLRDPLGELPKPDAPGAPAPVLRSRRHARAARARADAPAPTQPPA